MRFIEQILTPKFGRVYSHVMVIDGNDDRGIDVGIMSRFPIRGIVSHVDDRNDDGNRTFSRDCPEFLVELPTGQSMTVMPNHFKSKRGGDTPAMQKRRRAQAERAHAIAVAALQKTPLVLIAGDLNDTPARRYFNSLWQNGFVDVNSHADYPTDRPGTFDTGTAGNKIDYLIMSPAAARAAPALRHRAPRLVPPAHLAAIRHGDGEEGQASDHHAVVGHLQSLRAVTMATTLPFSPVRSALYSADELLAPGIPQTPADWIETADFRIYRHFVLNGGKSVVRDSYVRLMQSIHTTRSTRRSSSSCASTIASWR
jgi:endonuclease/exonuclease/phosphatase family metal-dependent hydrolase